jgi:hypothetical protein
VGPDDGDDYYGGDGGGSEADDLTSNDDGSSFNSLQRPLGHQRRRPGRGSGGRKARRAKPAAPEVNKAEVCIFVSMYLCIYVSMYLCESTSLDLSCQFACKHCWI